MRITVAEIVTTHGINGNLKVKNLSDNEKRFENGEKLLIDNEELTVESSFDQKGLKVIKFEEYNNINDVLKFIGKDITIEDKDLGKLHEDEYYVFQLEGLDVYDNGQKVGTIKEVITGVYPNDVYVIKTDKDEVYFPALNATVKKVDLENGFIEIENFSDYE
ncbi:MULTISPECIES: ribosome maturation factor RimM [Anaerococcus]|uniref:Ribosome maturation factor RimM n=1 Tax=Anaerococcus nagyae TaxID=1755241 RepID=A0A3E2TI13_9FIRM|nr:MULTISPECIES: ribosome maturation factor RimM [Anaerococcus]MBP2069489.1 16S rRNA processing protein RimM [Anaerococcus nagyae]MDU1829434.1 ribosome maturation factor RimM [Anaerococcus sp.]MDU1864200.1 ribosome maturation factor RimM [Anaerococcus sp.]MDU2354054.1 ribosome maturation factor RimM [Anaerococcus sp.]MDU2565341.1 ribosome maturation factor RimM [Anaerococcus sp.]